MGKLCLESWVPPSRQGSPADVGRGICSSPEGKRAPLLADADWGPGDARTVRFYLQSITIVDKRGECVLQGIALAWEPAAQASIPRAAAGFPRDLDQA